MVTGHTKEIQAFNQFFENNYRYLRNFCKSIDPKHHYEDTLHQCYLKAHDKIDKCGYDGDDFLNYFRVIIMNTFKGNYTQEKKYSFIDIEDPNFIPYIDNILLYNEDQEDQETELHHRNIYINSVIFEFLDKYCTQKEVFIFKSYFLLHHKKLTYKKLAEITGYSLNSVANIIKRIKKQLRKDLVSYINTGLTMEELINEVKILLDTKLIGRDWNAYCDMYKKITGNRWTACKCKSQRLLSWMQNWYNTNKTT